MRAGRVAYLSLSIPPFPPHTPSPRMVPVAHGLRWFDSTTDYLVCDPAPSVLFVSRERDVTGEGLSLRRLVPRRV